MLTGDRQPLPLRGCKACGTFGFVGPDRERCQLCDGVGCVAGEPICAAPDCSHKRLYASWFCADHDLQFDADHDLNRRLDMN
jgi:hypothetical protein